MAITAGLHAHAAECNVAVYVHERVPIPWSVSTRAEAKAADMFREIGVQIRWHSGEIKASDADRSCGIPLVVEIQDARSDIHLSPGALANAKPFMDSGTSIHVFMDRIHRDNDRLTAALLAHVLVHEIGHVLERISRHSDDGVMKAHWSSMDCREMSARSLPFAPEDVELIHLGIARRMALTAAR
jgi:hypothetical protein